MKALPSIAALTLLACFAQAADQPPENIIEHYKWATNQKSRSNSIARLEAFYQKHRPPNDDAYEDAVHVRFVRLSAYRLVHLYSARGEKEKAKFYLNWLEKTDQAVR